jgi:putative spermidine/putrescine transport system permease protein
MKILLNSLLFDVLQMLKARRIVLQPDLSSTRRMVELFLQHLPEHLDHPWTLDTMAKHCGLARSRFAHYCQEITNLSPARHLTRCRLEAAARLLRESPGVNVTDVALACGFSSSQYFSNAFRRAFGTSLAVAVLTCVAVVAVGLPLAYAVFRAESRRVRAAARILYQLPVALPALVLAFGFILVFSSDTLPWLGSLWLLVAGHIVLGLPYFLQTVVADMQRLGLRALEDAAESLGSTGTQRFFHIVLPALRHSVLSGLIVVAALSIGEFQFSNLVAGFLNRTYPVVLLQAFYGATGFACAATVVLLALALTASVAGALTTRGAAGPVAGAQAA